MPDRPVPTLGCMVHVYVHPSLNNGVQVAPAVITRLFGPHPLRPEAHLVNLRVFLNGTNHAHEWATSRLLWPTKADADREWEIERAADKALDQTHHVSYTAFWPERV